MVSTTRRKFYVGYKQGSWEILEFPSGSLKALMRCDCGYEGWKYISNLSSHKSRRCQNCVRKSPEEKTYNSVVATANRRGIKWNLSLEDWKLLADANCSYCGSEPSNLISSLGYLYNGVDRVDSNGCYSVENCVTSCRFCNRSKSDMSEELFLDWVKRIYETKIVSKSKLVV